MKGIQNYIQKCERFFSLNMLRLTQIDLIRSRFSPSNYIVYIKCYYQNEVAFAEGFNRFSLVLLLVPDTCRAEMKENCFVQRLYTYYLIARSFIIYTSMCECVDTKCMFFLPVLRYAIRRTMILNCDNLIYLILKSSVRKHTKLLYLRYTILYLL